MFLNSRKVDQDRRQDSGDHYDRNVVALFDLRPPREPRERVRLHSSTLLFARFAREFSVAISQAQYHNCFE